MFSMRNVAPVRNELILITYIIRYCWHCKNTVRKPCKITVTKWSLSQEFSVHRSEH